MSKRLNSTELRGAAFGDVRRDARGAAGSLSHSGSATPSISQPQPLTRRQALARRQPLSRRAMLKAAGVAFALPLLDAMRPAWAGDREPEAPRRLVAIETNMGILPQFFFPDKAGEDYAPSPYLQRLAAHRRQLTVFSGVSLPGVTGGHAAERCFLTGTPHPERGGFRNGVSVDQFAAEQIGSRTRYPSLVLAITNENPTLSFTRSGAPIPAEKSPRKLFERLFFQGKPEEIADEVEQTASAISRSD